MKTQGGMDHPDGYGRGGGGVVGGCPLPVVGLGVHFFQGVRGIKIRSFESNNGFCVF